MKNTHLITVGYSYNDSDDKLPLIRISGKWLLENGFNIGDKVFIETDEENPILTLTKVDLKELEKRKY